MAYVSDESNELKMRLEAAMDSLEELREELVLHNKRDPLLDELDHWVEALEEKMEEID